MVDRALLMMIIPSLALESVVDYIITNHDNLSNCLCFKVQLTNDNIIVDSNVDIFK